ncbi:hypothetical protein GIB67_038956 [Kingdonia uniflora]|uniref:Uncharacterized protein n=1 Tax=Kingdonia uniflora TaxID=39325 RepID=A0A7J7P8H0_9MAGN|nr:hypothetical protein GIB67_038956 [Kingdonia uniflora]
MAKDYRIIRQRVHAILWLKEIEEEEEKKRGPLDDSIERLLDTCPEFFDSHDREFHVASLPYKPDFKVMPEGWDGTTKDPDEVHYEISVREDEMLYQDFVRRMTFNKKQAMSDYYAIGLKIMNQLVSEINQIKKSTKQSSFLRFQVLGILQRKLGVAVVRESVVEDLPEGHGDIGTKELMHMSEEETKEYLAWSMWYLL